MKVFVSRTAHRDLAEIQDLIADDNPQAAIRTADRLLKAIRGLERMPRRFPTVPGTSLRRRAVGAYLIFYTVADKVEVVRVVHGARDWLTLLDGQS